MRKISIGTDSPIRDKAYPPGQGGFSCLSEDTLLFGVVYYAEGRENPTVVFCHGFPGMEKNHDQAQILRQAGFNVVIFAYRGAWGSRGAFSFTGVSRDTVSVVRHFSHKKLPHSARFDASRMILLGHSLGAFAALRAASELPEVRDIALLATWNIGRDAAASRVDPLVKSRLDSVFDGARCLNGTSSASLWNEVLKNADEFDLLRLAPAFASRRVLLVGARDDSSTPPRDHQTPLRRALLRSGAEVVEKMFTGDHAFSSKRFGLAKCLLKWLAEGGY